MLIVDPWDILFNFEIELIFPVNSGIEGDPIFILGGVMSDAVSECLECGKQVPLGFKLCEDCRPRGAGGALAKGLKPGYVDYGSESNFPMMFLSSKDVAPVRVDAQRWRDKRRRKRFHKYAIGSRKITEFFKKRPKKPYKNLARTARFAHYGGANKSQ